MGYYGQIVTILKNLFLRYKGVRTFIYQDRSLNNAQNNHETFQVYLDSQSLHQLNITENVVRCEFSLFILSQPSSESGNTLLDVQDTAYQIAANVIAKLDTIPEYAGILSVHDWSLTTVDHVSDDDSAGAHMTLVLAMPNPANLCNDEDWSDEPYSGQTDYDVDVDVDELPELDLNPISLPKNPIRC